MKKPDSVSVRMVWLCILLCSVWRLTEGQQIHIGLTGGITASQVDGDAYTGFNKLGIIAGGFVSQEIDYDISWQADLHYVTRGVYKGPGENDPTLYRSSYHYIEIPLTVHYLYNQKVQLEVGTSPEVLIKTVFADQDGIIDPASYPDDIRRIGLTVLGGITYWFSETAGVGIRYTYSAIPFRDPQEWNHPRYRGYFHNVISLAVSYYITGR